MRSLLNRIKIYSLKEKILSVFNDLASPWLLFPLGAAFLFSVNRYRGLVSDATLYLVQLAHYWFPERFVGDISFAYGSQDMLNLFSPVYGLFVRLLGAEVGSLALVLFFQAVFAISITYLILQFSKLYLKEWMAVPVLLFYLGFYAYGMPGTMNSFVRLIEGLAISRLAAIATGVSGLAFLVARKKWLTLMMFLVSMSMHPLIGGWGVPLWLMFYYPKSQKPIIIASFFFPITIFINHAPFSSFSKSWGDIQHIPALMFPDMEDFSRYFCLISYYFFVVKKLSTNDVLVSFSKVISFLLVIALYWWCWGGFAGHVFLYQVQTFRIEWICQIMSFPLFVNLTYNRIREYEKMGSVSTYDMALVLSGLSLFLPGHIWELSAIATLFLLHKSRPVTARIAQILFVFISLYSVFYQVCFRLFMEGAPIPFLRHFLDASAVSESLVLIEIFISVSLVPYMWKKKKYLCCAALVLFFIFPSMLLIPLVVCIAWFAPTVNKKTLTILSIVAVVEGIVNWSIRINYIPLPSPFFRVLSLWSIGLFLLLASCLIPFRKKILAISCGIIYTTICIFLALESWDGRSSIARIEEKQIDEFVNEPLFPEVKNQGRILYYVSKGKVSFPGLQFLNGRYFDENSLTGAIFFKQQFYEGNRRRNMLYNKKAVGPIDDGANYESFVFNVLSNRDSLIDRTNFLCSSNEISYLITDYDDLPYEKKNTRHLKVFDMDVFLYKCFFIEEFKNAKKTVL